MVTASGKVLASASADVSRLVPELPTSQMLRDARTRVIGPAAGLRAAFIAGDARFLPIRSRRFAKVYCSAVLHTLPSTADGLAAIDELIRKGRTVVVVTCSIHSTEVGGTFTATEAKRFGLIDDIGLLAVSPAWQIVPYHDGLDLATLDRHAVTEFPTENGPADYALFVRGRWLGIIEAKKVGVYVLDGEYYAIEDVCPHAYALLSQGFVADGQVECPLHESIFDIRTGECLREPADRDLHVYPVRIIGDEIQLQIDDEA